MLWKNGMRNMCKKEKSWDEMKKMLIFFFSPAKELGGIFFLFFFFAWMIAPTGMDALLRAVRFQSSRKEVLSQCAQVSREEFLSWRDRDASDRLTALHVAILANRHVATLLSYYKVFFFFLSVCFALSHRVCVRMCAYVCIRGCIRAWIIWTPDPRNLWHGEHFFFFFFFFFWFKFTFPI